MAPVFNDVLSLVSVQPAILSVLGETYQALWGQALWGQALWGQALWGQALWGHSL